MRESWSWRDTVFATWCAVLITAAILAIVPGWSAVGELLANPAAASWVQAIGSVLTLIGAFVVVRLQLVAQHESEAERARLLRVQQLHALLVLMSTAAMEAKNIHSADPFRADWNRYVSHAAQLAFGELQQIGPLSYPEPTLLHQAGVLKWAFSSIAADVGHGATPQSELRFRATKAEAIALSNGRHCEALLWRAMKPSERQEFTATQHELARFREQLGLQTVVPPTDWS